MTWSNISLQDANSFISEEMIFFHDLVMMVNCSIIMMIIYAMLCIFNNKIINRYLLQANMTEIIWTIIPMITLLMLSIPSLKILYLTDEVYNPMMTLKAIGHQWYWSYEYTDFFNIQFDSYMLKEFKLNNFRLLDVDNRMIFPMQTPVRILITSTDVIHSWTVPSLGIKVDAIPGRLNQTPAYAIRPGLYFGQCSEICGANHSFMPIVLESVNYLKFLSWMKFNINNL